MNGKHKFLYLATSLKTGGTERYLNLLAESYRGDYDITVGYLKENGATGEALAQAGFAVRPFTGLFDIAAFLAMNDIDLLHTFMYRANIMGRIAGQLSGTPVIISTQQAIDSWKTWPYVYADALTARWANRIIANSNAARDSLVTREKIIPQRISVIYNGVQQQPARKPRGSAGVTVVSLTRLHQEKGADRLPQIAARAPSCDFMVAGDGPLRPMLENAAVELRLSGRFSLKGWVSDINTFLAGGDIFLLSSREESMPQAILEAMAAGLPVVAADVGGVRELVEDGITGYVVPSDDIGAYAAAIERLASLPRLREDMGAAGREKASKFTSEEMLKRTKALYDTELELAAERER